MKSLLVVIDLQEAFVNDSTKDVVFKIDSLIKENKYDDVVFTRFINSTDSIWYKKLNYKECIAEESKKIIIDTQNYIVIDKFVYSALNDEFINYVRENNIDRIHLCGIDTECCVLKTAFDLFENKYDVSVLKDYCGCMEGVDRHNNALDILRRNIGSNNVL